LILFHSIPYFFPYFILFYFSSLTPAAANVLQSFYLDLRQKYRSVDSTPITTRQLESMVRLAEARARLELREKVTESDAKDVVQIMFFFFFPDFICY